MTVHTRLVRLEQRIGPPAPPAKKYKIIPEYREVWQELTPILNESPPMRAILEDLKKFGMTDEIQRRFWCGLRELLLPNPTLYQRVSDTMYKQIKANQAADAKQVNH